MSVIITLQAVIIAKLRLYKNSEAFCCVSVSGYISVYESIVWVYLNNLDCTSHITCIYTNPHSYSLDSTWTTCITSF